MNFPVVDPLRALRRVRSRWRPHRVESMSPEKAQGRVLARSLSIPPTSRVRELNLATRNGYALPRGTGHGSYRFRMPRNSPEPNGAPGEEEGDPVLERVETGQYLSPLVDRVVPVERTAIVARPRDDAPRVRIDPDAMPPAGYGMVCAGDASLEVDVGTQLEPRLLSVLLAYGLTSLETFSPEEVGILIIGTELTDLLGGADAEEGTVFDLSGFWLPSAVRTLGHIPHSLGIVSDDLAECRRVFLRAREKKLRTLITCGGLGDGVGDRTVELLSRIGAKIFFQEVTVRPGRRFLAGEWQGIKILALGGQPREAAVAFDNFVQPALLSARGTGHSGSAGSDWSRTFYPCSALAISEEAHESREELHFASHGEQHKSRGEKEKRDTGEPWSTLPLKIGIPGQSWIALSPRPPHSSMLPWIPGQVGWALLPPELPSDSGRPEESPGPAGFYFQPCLSASPTTEL